MDMIARAMASSANTQLSQITNPTTPPSTGDVLTWDATDVPVYATLSGSAASLPWIDVTQSPYSADNTGTDDCTAAFQAAIDECVTAKAQIVVPAGNYRMTGELSATSAISMIGMGSQKTIGSSMNGKAVNIIFDNTDVDGSANATKCCLRLTKDVAYAFSNLHIENIGFYSANPTVKNQHCIILVNAEILGSRLKNISYDNFSGYGFYITGNSYFQHIDWENWSFTRMGGCVGRSGTGIGVFCTMGRISNFNLDVSVNSTSPQTVLYDFTGFRHCTFDTLLAEGSLPVTDIIVFQFGFAASATSYWESLNTVNNVWIEFTTNQPAYGILVLDNEVTFNGVYGINNATQFAVDGDYTHVKINNLDASAIADFATMFEFRNTLSTIEIDGIKFSSATAPDRLSLGKTGRLSAKKVNHSGVGHVIYDYDDSKVLYKYVPGNYFRNNKFVTFSAPVATQLTSAFLDVDATEGRVIRLKNSTTNDVPYLSMTLDIPAEMYGCTLIVGIRYMVETTDETASNVLLGYVNLPTGGASDVINAITRNAWTTMYQVIANVQTGTFKIATGTWSHNATAAQDLLISDLVISIGRKLPLMSAICAATQPIIGYGTASPAAGTYIAGDIVYKTNPTGSGDIGWVCTTGGTPGTWTSFVTNGTSYTENNFVAVTGNKTLALTDATTTQKVTAAAAITVPPNANVDFNVGAEIVILSYTASEVSIVAGAGVTIYSKSSYLKIDGQYAGATLKQVANDEWVLVGSLKA